MRAVEQPARDSFSARGPLAAGGFATAVPRGDPPMRGGATRAVTASLHEPLCGRRIRNGCSSWPLKERSKAHISHRSYYWDVKIKSAII
ncbi:hypothetical protein NDU88_003339 [Pleurodeles waltl]|uniref:Uncharacterized protein n=1 Tax=Pleurodeles waltl TaxID=8319 RepID=A0AAV7VD30_PLEWA|nr:hypothetical protein NDU88_003339 [Pleurodeles waltl]